MKAGLDGSEGQGAKLKPSGYRNSGVCLAQRLSWLPCLSPLCRQKPRGKSDWLQTEGRRGESDGGVMLIEEEDILAQQRGEMPTWR